MTYARYKTEADNMVFLFVGEYITLNKFLLKVLSIYFFTEYKNATYRKQHFYIISFIDLSACKRLKV